METLCIPIDRRNECREAGGNGIGKDGDPAFTITTPGGGCGIQLVMLYEDDKADSDK